MNAPAAASGPASTHDMRRLDIQGLRAIAVLLVVAFHSGLPLPGGFIGVDVFFVISGFVIGGLLLRELDATGRISFGRFYARRIKRLFPALALLVAVVALASGALASPFAYQTTATTGIGAILVAANAVIYRTTGGYFDSPAATNALLHTWSLSVEEQFYLLFPALLAGAFWAGRKLRLRRGRAAVGLALVVVGVASLSLSMWFGLLMRLGLDKPAEFAFYSSPTRAWEFAVGAGLVLAMGPLARAPRRLASFAGAVGASLLLAGSLAINSQTPFPGTAALLPVGGTALLIASGTAAQGALARLLSVRPLVWIGDRSYSWYLWHWPLVVFARGLWPESNAALVAAAVSLIPASLSYRYVENPIRYRTSLRGRRIVALGATCILLAGATCLLVLAGLRISLPETAAMVAEVEPFHAGYARGCIGSAPTDSRWTSICTWNANAPGAPIYLVGDSQADMLSEAVITAATALDRRLVIADEPDCQFADIVEYKFGLKKDRCRPYLDRLFDLLSREPGLVVVASGEYVIWSEFAMASPTGGAPATAALDKASIYEDGLRRALSQLQAAGNQVLLVQPIPHFYVAPFTANADIWSERDKWDPSRCPAGDAQFDPSRCGVKRPLTDVVLEQATVFDANARVAEAIGASTLDLRRYLCVGATCLTNWGNRWLYRDGIHLTVQASEDLAPAFRDALSSMIAGPLPSR